MGCCYETAKQIIRLNEISTPAIYLNARTRICSKKSEKQFPYNSSKLNQHLTKNPNNNDDDCQLVRVQQQQEHKLQNPALINTTITTKANNTLGTTTTTTRTTVNPESNNKARGNLTTSLETQKHINRINYSVPQETFTFEKVQVKNKLPALPESCINCYPLACHNRFCCRQQSKQQPHTVANEITNRTRQTLKPSTCIKINSNNNSNTKGSYSNCSNNNYCRCHISFSYRKHTQNTLRHEQAGEPQPFHCNCDASQTTNFATFAKGHSANGQYLQKTISHARTALTVNALDLKNHLMRLMANCTTVADSLTGFNALFIKHGLSNGNSDDKFNTNNNNNNSNNKINNHDKSEPSYRGYCQRIKNHLSNKTSSYTSSTILNTSDSTTNSISNSCSLHNAISSNNSRCNINNHDSNTISCSSNTNSSSSSISSGNSNNNNHNAKRFNKNNHSCQALSAHAAAFNYFGQNYYSFLRNTINFYTASSVILVLCYLTTTTSAADTTSIDKHPIRGIDWSKFDESSSDKEILDLLLEKKRYDKRLLPPVNGTLTVNVNVLLLSLASPDESSLKYEVEFLLNQQWNDPRLQYGNKSHYDFLNALHHHDSIWTPDTYFIMHGDFKDPIIPMHFALRIYRNGTITYAMRRHLILSCQGSLHIFPFDDPKCSFSMESISYEEAQIKYIWKNDEDTLRKSPSLTTLNAYLIKNQTTACDQNSWRGNYSCLQVELTFTRDRAYYFTTVFIPGIILVTSSFITFWLEWNAVPARVMIGVTTMLNFFTTSNGFRSTLPVVSNLTAMNVWDGVCMCFIYASLLEFVCVNYMGRKRPQHNVVYRPGENPVTQGEKKRDAGGPNEIVACTTCGGSSGSPCTHSANNGCATETCFVQVRKKEPPHPIRIAKTIDVIARITFPTAYAIFLIFFFVHYKGFS